MSRLETCLNHDWSKDLARFAREVELELKRRSSDLEAKLSRAMSAAIDTWFLSGHSLLWLIDKQWRPLLKEYRSDLHMVALRRFEESCVQSDAGLDLDPEVQGLLRSFHIEIQELRRAAQATQGRPVWQALPEMLIDASAIPVRRGVFNVLTLRNVDTVRQRMFGPDEKPDFKIAPKTKAARLGEPAKHHLRRTLGQMQAAQIRKTTEATRHRFCMALENATAAEVARRLKILEPDLRAELAQIDRDGALISDLLEPVCTLRTAIENSLCGLQEMSTRYAKIDTDLLIEAHIDAMLIYLKQDPAAGAGK